MSTNLQDLDDDVQLSASEPVDTHAIAIRTNIERVESALSEFDKISDGLATLAAKYPVDLVYDVTTTKGMAEAIAHRAAWRDPRILVEKFRKTAKAPVLALGKDIDARAAWITEQLLIGETPVHEQIKAEEARKEAEKQARINAEIARVQAIEEAIAELAMESLIVSGKPSPAISEKLDQVRAMKLDPLVFQERMLQAEQAKTNTIAKLEQMLKAQLFTEAEAAKLAAEREELAQLRAAQAAQKAKDEAAAAELRKSEEARIGAERKLLEEQQAEIDRQKRELAAAQVKASPPQPANVIPMVAQSTEPAALNLGTICARLGITMTAAFVSETLGVQPSATDKAAKLYRESDFARICAALQKHISAAYEKFAA